MGSFKAKGGLFDPKVIRGLNANTRHLERLENSLFPEGFFEKVAEEIEKQQIEVIKEVTERPISLEQALNEKIFAAFQVPKEFLEDPRTKDAIRAEQRQLERESKAFSRPLVLPPVAKPTFKNIP